MSAETILKHMHEVCPFRIGNRVVINPANRYASEWPLVYVVTSIRWEYQKGGRINLGIAGDSEIERGHGETDGWHVDDLWVATAFEIAAGRRRDDNPPPSLRRE